MIKQIKTGISFLDNNFGCLRPNEFMLIGASTGIGKTTLANSIAESIVAQGYKPALLSLENAKGDTRGRIAYNKWREDSQQYYYPERIWQIEAQNGEHDEYLVYAQEQLKKFKLVEVAGDVPTILQTQSIYAECSQQGVDVVILDHLDYIKQENNNIVGHMNQLVGMIKNMTELTRIPCLAFSHLAKVIDGKKIIPGLDDFYGSSNKTKVCTSAIVIAPDWATVPQTPDLKPTYFAIRKDRYGRTVNKCGRMFFNVCTQKYEDDYDSLMVSTYGDKVWEA